MVKLVNITVFRNGFTGGGNGVKVGCYFHDKAEKYERHNEIHVIVMICHTVSIVYIFVTANCFNPLDV